MKFLSAKVGDRAKHYMKVIDEPAFVVTRAWFRIYCDAAMH
jgi:hypothetical protein